MILSHQPHVRALLQTTMALAQTSRLMDEAVHSRQLPKAAPLVAAQPRLSPTKGLSKPARRWSTKCLIHHVSKNYRLPVQEWHTCTPDQPRQSLHLPGIPAMRPQTANSCHQAQKAAVPGHLTAIREPVPGAQCHLSFLRLLLALTHQLKVRGVGSDRQAIQIARRR